MKGGVGAAGQQRDIPAPRFFGMDDLLQYAIEHGMINLLDVQKQVEMNKREEILSKHPYKIWIGKDGKYRTYLPDEDIGRRLVKRSGEKSIEDEVIKYWKEKEENPTLKDVFTEWNDRKLELKKIAASTHLRNRQIFNRHYKEFGERKIKSIEPEEIGEFLEEQIPKFELTSKAFSNLKTVTRGFLKFAKRKKFIKYNVEEIFQELDTTDADFRKVIKEDYEEVFDEVEMPEVMEYLSKNLDINNIIILLMFVTGIRIGEAVALKPEDFDDCTVKIRRTETRFEINNKYVYSVKEYPKSPAGVRTVVIPSEYEWLLQKIHSLNPEGEYVFMKRGERVRTPAVRMRLKRICDKLEIYRKSPHKIRKTYGTILLDNHIDNQLIIGQMGHTNILCTENHYHRNRKSIERKSSILSAIPEFQSNLITR